MHYWMSSWAHHYFVPWVTVWKHDLYVCTCIIFIFLIYLNQVCTCVYVYITSGKIISSNKGGDIGMCWSSKKEENKK